MAHTFENIQIVFEMLPDYSEILHTLLHVDTNWESPPPPFQTVAHQNIVLLTC